MKIGGWAPHELHEHEAEEVARDQAEGVRLAYVAATRARDLLVVPGARRRAVGRRLVRPAEPRAVSAGCDRAATPTRGPKCPAFKSKDTVLQRPNDETAGTGDGVPGRSTRFAAGGYSVVWWDPSALDARREAAVRRAPRRSHRQGRAAATSSPTAAAGTTAGGWRARGARRRQHAVHGGRDGARVGGGAGIRVVAGCARRCCDERGRDDRRLAARCRTKRVDAGR